MGFSSQNKKKFVFLLVKAGELKNEDSLTKDDQDDEISTNQNESCKDADISRTT